MNFRGLLPVIPLVIFISIASLLPIVYFLLNAFQTPAGEFTLREIRNVFSQPAYLTSIWNTIEIALLVDLLILALAYPVALTIHLAQGWRRTVLLICVLLPFFTSVLVRTYAWSVVLGLEGPVNGALVATGILDEPYLLGHSTIGTVIGLVHILMPPAVLAIYTIMGRIDSDLMVTAKSLGAGNLRAFFTVFFPLSMPGIVLGGLLTFVMALGAFVIPQLLGGVGNLMFGQIIVLIATVSLDWNFASAMSLIFLILLAVPIYGLVRGGQFGDVSGEGRGDKPSRIARLLSRLLAPLGAIMERLTAPVLAWLDRVPASASAGLRIAVALAVVVFLIVPEALIVILSFGDPDYLSWPPTQLNGEAYALFFQQEPWVRALRQSVQFGVVTMIVSVLIGSVAAYGIVRGRFPGKSLIISLALVPLILPEIVPAIAYYIAASAFGVSGTAAAIVAGQGVTATALVLLVMTAVFRSLKVDIEYAARACGAGPVRGFVDVVIPLVWPSLIVASLFSFLNAFDNLLIPLFMGGRYQTLPVYMWLQMREATSPMITVVASIMILVVVLFGVLANFAQQLQARRLAQQ
ncbi:putative spermidine/putrescine transport system permease protein [Paracoccus isoporae]|uniref:Putative spermidine/putrescine transport system permease protein n=1 Tax=Paracoccus isoporae TaxID=591205 RepID=A0A1G6ZIA8_9RHOB|nr:ABC transporter permease subunit [Paracoccus isoporae]SDE02474.1 putative spermidine/putrescine transport system permease protein [Paracoccus isoporae]